MDITVRIICILARNTHSLVRGKLGGLGFILPEPSASSACWDMGINASLKHLLPFSPEIDSWFIEVEPAVYNSGE